MSALNFPASPDDGDVYENYKWSDAVGAWLLIPPATLATPIEYRRHLLTMGA